ncbi:hypothetical protein ACFWIW_10845 [Amycolatopsis sp. NPDC058340]|uniref:hypothetical protein n=1 Tax=Amycolatopsis sp. NPDC058340 TaxID=3346453 RepID=UPI00364DF7AB
MESELTSGAIATMILVPLALAALVAIFVMLRRYAAQQTLKAAEMDATREAWTLGGKHAREDATFAVRLSWLAPVVTAAVLALTWWGMYPWKHEYHHWTPVAGVVETVDSRLVAAGENTMQDKFVVKFTGNDQQYGVLDTRAAGLKPGDRLTITCVRIWQWTGSHGYDCNFISLERAR